MLWRRFKALWTRRREDQALIEELEFHRSQIQADLESQGLPAAEACDASRRAMGNTSLAREDAREVWLARWADQLLLDLRCGFRSLLHQPSLTLAALLATALGVATTTTAFSVADSELWKPLPFSRSDQLVAVTTQNGPGERAPVNGISGADLIEWRRGTSAFSAISSSGRSTRQVLQLRAAESVTVSEVTANYFSTLERPALAGRVFEAGDAVGERRVVLTDRAWRRIFGADPAVIGRSVRLDERPAVIIGIVPSTIRWGRTRTSSSPSMSSGWRFTIAASHSATAPLPG